MTGQMNFKNVIMQVPNTTTTMGAVQIGDINNDGLNDVVCGSVYSTMVIIMNCIS
jgi:hypothetical protein